jgi:tetratricopeptide (TPR) repeat protein
MDLILWLLLILSRVNLEPNWVGRAVLVKQTGIKISRSHEPQNPKYVGTLDGFCVIVTAECRGRVKIKTRHGVEGWLEKVDAVPLEDAFDYFSRCILENPDDSEMYRARGEASVKSGEFDVAIRDLNRAIRLNPGSALSYAFRGAAWTHTNQYDKAIADLSEAIRLDPNDATFRYARGAVWASKQGYHQAFCDFSEAIRLDRNCVDAYIARAAVWTLKKNYQQAIADCDEAIRFDPKNVSAYYNRGIAWRANGDCKNAIADYTAAIGLDANFAAAFNNRGDVWFELKEYEKALADRRQAIRLDPKTATAYAGIAHIHATCPDPLFRDGERAVEFAKRALDLDKDNPLMMSVLAAAYAEAFEYAKAVQWQEHAMKNARYRDNPDMQRRLDLYHMKMPYREQ